MDMNNQKLDIPPWHYIILAGLPGIARAFTTLKYYVHPPHPTPGALPQNFQPLYDLARVVLDLSVKFQLNTLETVRMHRDRQTDRDRDNPLYRYRR